MVLCHQNDVLGSGGLNGPHPLLGIELRGIEYLWAGCAVAPFAIHKRIRAKVNDYAKLEVLPCHLLRRGFNVGKILRLRG